MKRLKGLYTDCDPVDQPEGTYRDAQNININDQAGAIVTERGTSLVDSLPSGNLPLGHILLSDQRVVIFSKGTTSEIGVLEDGVYTTLLDESTISLNFQLNSNIQGTSRLNSSNEEVIYWTDGINPPRYLNIDKAISVGNASELNIFTNYDKTAEINLESVNDFGGSLVSGAYQFAIRYIDEENNPTNFTSITSPIDVVRSIQNEANFNFNQGNPTALTGKSISLLLENLDTTFNRFQLAIIRYEGAGIADVKLLSPLDFSDESIEFLYTGAEDSLDGSLEEVLINNATYKTAKTLTQTDSTLYLGNLTKEAETRFQKFANSIVTESKTKTLDGTTKQTWSYGDETATFFNKSFKREEVYAFYISFVLKTGEETRAFHIPGRSSEGDELDPADSPFPVNLATIDEDAKNFHFYAKEGSNGMAYWENENETYPDRDDWDVVTLDGSGNESQTGTLRNAKVRHHRFPSIIDKPIVKSVNADGRDASVDILGVQFSNIKIPADILENITAVKFHYARKTRNNTLVLDQGWALHNRTDGAATAGKPIQNYISKTLSGTGETMGAISMVPFSTMYRNLNIAGATYLRFLNKPKISRIQPEGNNGIAHIMDQEVIDYENFNYARKIRAIARVPSDTDLVTLSALGFERDKKTTKEESQIVVDLENNTSNGLFYAIPTTDIASEVEVGDLHGFTGALMQYKKEVFAPFDLQELVPMGTYAKNLDNFAFNATEDTGVKATASIEVLEDAAPEEPATLASTDEVTVTGTCDADFNLKVAKSGDTTASFGITNGDTAADIVDAIVAEINTNNPGLYTYEVVTTSSSSFFLRNKTAGADASLVDFLADDTVDAFPFNGITFTPSSTAFADGTDAVEGDIGEIDIALQDVSTVQNRLKYTVQYGDSKETIAAELAHYLNNHYITAGLPQRYEATVTGAVIDIVAIDEGEEWNGLIIEETNDSGVNLSLDAELTGGVDTIPANSSIALFKGDTFINKYGFRVGATIPAERVQVLYTIVESTDNIAFRQSGENYGEINANDASRGSEMVLLEDNNPDVSSDEWFDNFYAYDEAHSVDGHLLSKTTPFPKRFEEQLNLPTRVVRSQTDSADDFTDSFRRFLDQDFLDFPRNRGEITNLDVLNNILLVHTERGLFRTRGREELVTGDFRAFLGSGDIFAVKPDEMSNAEEGFAGLQDSKSCVVTTAGYLFVDQQAKKVFSLRDGVQEISDIGMRNFFKENLQWYIDLAQKDLHNKLVDPCITIDYDPIYRRVLLTKRDWKPTDALLSTTIGFNEATGKVTSNGTDIELTNETFFEDKSFTISYLPELDRWISFHSYTPFYYFRDLDFLYSVSGNDLYSHNGDYCSYYGSVEPMVFEFVDNQMPHLTKLLQNVEFSTYVYDSGNKIIQDETFDSLRISNELQDTGDVSLVYFTEVGGNSRNVGHTWKVNKFRDLVDLDTGEINTSLPFHKQKKLTGKYAKIKLSYTPVNNHSLRLISAHANFRANRR